MSRILHRVLDADPPAIVKASGLWVTDDRGRTYLDAVSGGAAVSCLGHGHPRVADAVRAQILEADYFHTSFFTSEAAESLADALIELAPAGLERVVFSSGGSEAVETALKLVRQYWVERGQPERRRIVARHQSYHGGTLGTLSVGGNIARRETYAPLLFEAHFIEPCYAYRHRRPDETEAEYGRRAAGALERMILELGPDTVAAFICEPVVGATLGCAPAVEGYLKEIRAICDRYDVLLVFDEVMCGSGRTGHFFACAEDGATPDLLAIAKGLGGGFQAIGATLVGERVVEALAGGSGVLKHGFTYMGHASACAGALAVLEILREQNLLQAVRVRGASLRRKLREALADHPHVGDIRGRGLFLGIELVADPKTKRPFDPALRVHARFKQAAMARGLLTYPGSGTVDGRRGDHVLLAPAYTIVDDELDELVARFAGALGDVTDAVRSGSEVG